MRLTLALPFDVVLLSRATYTMQEAEDIILEYPIGFQIVSENEAMDILDPIYFPLVEDNHNARSC